jgi:hypothetical protein
MFGSAWNEIDIWDEQVVSALIGILDGKHIYMNHTFIWTGSKLVNGYVLDLMWAKNIYYLIKPNKF